MTDPIGDLPQMAPPSKTPPAEQSAPAADAEAELPGAQRSQGPGIPITRVAPRNAGGAKRHFNMPKLNNPLAGLSGKFAGLTGKLPGNWWIGLLGILVLVGGFYYFQTFGVPSFSIGNVGRALMFPGMPGVHIVITLATIALIIDCVLGLTEAQNREDPALLDWWIPYVVVGVLVYGQLYGTTVGWWWFVAGLAVASLFYATIWNPSDQEDANILDRIDTTAIFRTCFILGITFLAKWTILPYPVFIPPIFVLVIGALAIFKELMRTPKFALLVVLMGVAAAVFYNPLVVFGTLATAVVMAALGASQGWIPGA
ncbi:MAG: hypothetical protein WAV56_04535, partial [Microgenomates group bacterium]